MSRFRNLFLSASLALAATISPVSADASSRYFSKMGGSWKGDGSVVAGKYKGTRFNCVLNGKPTGGRQITINGNCRIGLFTQKISARLSKQGNSYRGEFLDGAKGKGMDITSGRLAARKLTVAINSKGLTGAIVANMIARNKMRVSISVRISNGRYVPVIGLDLKKG